MKKIVIAAALATVLVPMSALSASAKPKAPVTYECVKCHMHFTAAKAKADHYKDPMDGGKLVPTKKAKSAANGKGSTGGMKM